VPLTISAEALSKAGLPQAFEVRGEVIMPKTAFLRLNEEKDRRGLRWPSIHATPPLEPCALLEPSIVANRRLEFYAYFLLIEIEARASIGRKDTRRPLSMRSPSSAFASIPTTNLLPQSSR